MIIVARLAAGVLLLAHGLVHLLYLAPGVPEFSVDQSWLITGSARRPVALALMAAAVAAFALAALAVWGVPGLAGSWPVLTFVACLASMVLLAAFWNTGLVAGIIIDVALLVIAVTRPAWADRVTG